MTARETLDAAREAALEARRLRRMLAGLDGCAAERTHERVRAVMMHRLELCQRATAVGAAAIDAMGAAGIAGGWVLDAARAFYVDACEWDEAGRSVAYSGGHARREVAAAVRRADASATDAPGATARP